MGCVTSTPDVYNVLQPFHCTAVAHPLVVDVVGNHGYTWVKVIARKAQALHLVWAGGGQFGEKSIVEQARQYSECSRQHLHNYTPPQVVFVFIQGVTAALKDELVKLGIIVEGDVHEVDAETKQKVQQVMDAMKSDDEDEDAGLHSDDDDELCLIDDDGVWRIATPEEMAAKLKREKTSGQPHVNSGDTSKKHPLAETFTPSLVHKDTNRGLDEPSLQPAPSICESHPRQLSSDCDTPKSSSSSSSHVTMDTASPQHSLASSVDRSSLPSSGLSLQRTETLPVNLDVSTLICLVSNICHGHVNYVFEESILTQQAVEERAVPLLPKLQKFMEGKELLVCETAIKSFNSILHLIGGPEEQSRAAELLKKVKVVPDATSVQPLLQPSAKVKKRAQVIFSTGYELRAITMTANHGFVRATRNQGVSFAVFLHESRALTEMKQATAKIYVPENQPASE